MGRSSFGRSAWWGGDERKGGEGELGEMSVIYTKCKETIIGKTRLTNCYIFYLTLDVHVGPVYAGSGQIFARTKTCTVSPCVCTDSLGPEEIRSTFSPARFHIS